MNDDTNIERFYSLKFFIYPKNRLALPNVFRVTQKLDEFKPDIIHIMTEFSMGVAGLNYGKKNNIPTISNYTTNFSQYTEYYNLEIFKKPIWSYMRWFHNQNDITLCPSKEALKLLHSNGIRNAGIFSRGIYSDRFNPAFRDEALRRQLNIEDKITFLYVGRVSFEKELDVLCKSYRNIKEIYGDKIALVITGDGPYLDKCKETFPEDTIYTGFLKGTELAKMYASCDIFVCPSSTETFGNVILEAMASGLGVIGAGAGGIKEIIDDRYNGLKFIPKYTDGLEECMIELIEDKNLKEHVVNNGLAYAKNRTWNKIIDDLINIYSEILDRNNSKDIKIA
ncbi:MAG: glycosyltransferase family 1 protein [Clostridiales bacterium]|nr:glycosyltransferase family 1 protein [Clostridiales bacterium]